ncbi:MAG: hypothetical protein MUF73_03750 [Rhodobacteraceae bacterium]|jgi:hypothetical protein|nr:hypothetical protein [Paracoccaceae bacterium]
MVDATTSVATRNRHQTLVAALRAILRDSVHRVMVMWTIAMAGPRGGAPRAVFLPSRGREMSSLLRIYLVAAALRRRGWTTTVVPWRLGLDSRRQILSRLQPDVLVMQGARHSLNRPDLYPGERIAYDMDDADFHLDHLAEAVCDAMPKVDLVLAGSRYVADWCRAKGARADVVWTGTPVSADGRRPQAARGPVVAWTQTAPATYHRERAFVLDVMRRVKAHHPDVRLRLYDRRPGEPDTILAPFRTAGIAVEWRERLEYGHFLKSLQDVAVGLSPVCVDSPFSRGKSFGKILAYLDRGVPVVAGDAVDHPLVLDRTCAVLSNDAETCAAAVCRLLGSAPLRQEMADRGHARLLEVFAPDRVAEKVDDALRHLLAEPPRKSAQMAPPAATGAAPVERTGPAATGPASSADMTAPGAPDLGPERAAA